jgi:hypothetical protein
VDDAVHTFDRLAQPEHPITGTGAGLDPSDIASAPFLWHKGGDFVKAGTPIPLMYRMATAADVKPARGRKLSRHLWKLPPKQVPCSSCLLLQTEQRCLQPSAYILHMIMVYICLWF